MSTLIDTPPPDTPSTPPAGDVGTPPASVTPPASTPPVADWRAGLPEEIRADKSLESFKDVAALAQSYIATKKMVGTRTEIRPPTKDSTPEQVAAWRKANGVPDTPAGYLQSGVVRPEIAAGGDWDEQAESAFFGAMHALHAPPAIVNAAIQFYAKMESDKQAAAVRETQAAGQELRREWGPNYDANLGRANRAIQEFGGDEGVDLFASTGVGRHPVAVRMFAKIGNALVESGAMNPEGIAGTMNPDEARAAIRAKQDEMRKLPEGHPHTRQLIDEVLALTRIATATPRR